MGTEVWEREAGQDHTQGWAAAGSRGWESKNTLRNGAEGLGEQGRLLLVSSPLPVLFCNNFHKILDPCV